MFVSDRYLAVVHVFFPDTSTSSLPPQDYLIIKCIHRLIFKSLRVKLIYREYFKGGDVEVGSTMCGTYYVFIL